MLERFLIALVLVVLGTALWVAFKRYTVRRAANLSQADPLLAVLRPGTPAIVYFTTPFCVPCRTQQQPALAQLQAELGEMLQVIRIDATESPEIADRWGVFAAPTTFILNPELRPIHVNHGVATAETLKRQLHLTL